MTTDAPSLARRTAIDCPIPDEEPVTTATLPSKRFDMLHSLSSLLFSSWLFSSWLLSLRLTSSRMSSRAPCLPSFAGCPLHLQALSYAQPEGSCRHGSR